MTLLQTARLTAARDAPLVHVHITRQIEKYPWATYTPHNKPTVPYANATRLIHAIEVNALWDRLGTILSEGGGGPGGVRLDQQMALVDGKNLQIQLNGVRPTNAVGTTIAAVLLDTELQPYTVPVRTQERNVIRHAIVNALLRSLDEGRVAVVGFQPFAQRHWF